MVAAIIKLNGSIKEGRQQAGKNVSEVLSAQRIILCVCSSLLLSSTGVIIRGNGFRGQWVGFVG